MERTGWIGVIFPGRGGSLFLSLFSRCRNAPLLHKESSPNRSCSCTLCILPFLTKVRTSHWQRLVISAAAILPGLVIAGVSFPSPASAALNYDFYFAGVEGILEGLIDDSISQPTSMRVTGGAGVPEESLGTFIQISGTGFSVSGGTVIPYLPQDQGSGAPTPVEYSTYFYGKNSTGHTLFFGSFPVSPELVIGTLSGLPSDQWLPFGGVVSLSRRAPASVPAPLPLVGCVAALTYSRRIRNRIKAGVSASNAPQSDLIDCARLNKIS